MEIDIFLKNIARRICDFHSDALAKDSFIKFSKNTNCYFREAFKWHEQIEQSLLPKLREVYKNETSVLKTLERMEKNFKMRRVDKKIAS